MFQLDEEESQLGTISLYWAKFLKRCKAGWCHYFCEGQGVRICSQRAGKCPYLYGERLQEQASVRHCHSLLALKARKRMMHCGFYSPHPLCFANISMRQDTRVLLSKYKLNFHCLKFGFCNMHSIKSKKEAEKTPPANRRQTKLVAEAINAREIFFQVRFSR